MATSTKARPPVLDRLQKLQDRRRRVQLILDPEVGDALRKAEVDRDRASSLLERAENALRSAGKTPNGSSCPAERKAVEKGNKEVSEAEKRVEAASITFKFKGLGRKDYQELIEAHPATDKENEDHKEQYGVEAPYGESLAAPLISATLEDPEMTPEDVEAMFDQIHNTEIVELFQAAMLVCTERRTRQLGN